MTGDLGRMIRGAADDPANFPRLQAMLNSWGVLARQYWIDLVQKAAADNVQPKWWLNNYLGGDGTGANIQAEQRGLSVSVRHDDSGARYDYAKVIEEGRAKYDQTQALNTSEKVRIFKSGPNRGRRYLVIPFVAAKLSDSPDVVLQKVGEGRDQTNGGSVLRNRYTKTAGKSTLGSKGATLVEFHQKDVAGKTHRSQVNMVIMHEGQRGRMWQYPAIRAIAYSKKVEHTVRSGGLDITGPAYLGGDLVGKKLSFEQSIKAAAAADIADLIRRSTTTA